MTQQHSFGAGVAVTKKARRRVCMHVGDRTEITAFGAWYKTFLCNDCGSSFIEAPSTPMVVSTSRTPYKIGHDSGGIRLEM